MESIDERQVTTLTTLECGHTFHAECAIRWFRSDHSHGRCPMCRVGQRSELNVSVQSLKERISMVRAAARKKNAPAALKRIVQRLRDAESQEKEATAALRDANREQTVKAMRKRLDGLRRKRWNAWRRLHAQKKKVGLFDHSFLHGTVANSQIVLQADRVRYRRTRERGL